MKIALKNWLLSMSCLLGVVPSTTALAIVVDSGDTVTQTTDASTTPPSGATVTIDNGTFNVTSGVTVTGDPDAVRAIGPATIGNEGTITGAFNAVNFTTGSSGSLNNSGLITSDSRGVNIANTAGLVEIFNSGDILGTDDQRNGTVYSDASVSNFFIDNSGTIDAGLSNQGSGLALEIGSPLENTSTIINSGLIQGRIDGSVVSAASGLSADGLRFANFTGPAERVFSGTITNTVDGEIRSESANGTVAGVRFANTIGFQGELNNAGLIQGVQNGLYFGNAVNGLGADHTGGVVNNSGRIESDSRALNIDGLGLTVVNDGEIVGTGDQRNGTVYSDDTAQDYTLVNRGLIDTGVGNQGAAVSVSIGSDPLNADIVNSGTIQGRTVDAPTAPLAPTSTLAGDGVRLEGIRGTDSAGNVTFAPATFIGEVTNSGIIASGENVAGSTSGFHAVNGVSFQGLLTNTADGVISGPQNGVYFGNPVGPNSLGADHTGGVVNNSGLISSASRAFNLDGIGLTVNNDGQILGTGNQRNGTFYADGGADNYTVNNLLGGVIDAGAGNTGSGLGAEIGSALDGANTFSLTNAGTIQGRGNASAGSNAAGDGVRIGNVGNTGVAEVTLNNSGTINSEGANGTAAGIRFVNGISFAGELNNSGTISGIQNGLYFGNPVEVAGELVGADHSNGVVNNTGTISSNSRAFNLDGLGLTVNNAGDIVGTGNQRNGTFYADGGADEYTVNNSGTIDAGAGNTGSGLGAEIGSAVDGANTFSLDNSGTIQGRGNGPAGENSAGDGVRIGNVGNVGVAEVTLNNSGVIDSEGANGTVAGIRFVNGISFAGELNNTGLISGVQNGLYFGNAVNGQGADHSDGVVNNSGTISSDSRAFNLDGTGLTVNNSGDIAATGTQRNGTFYLDGTATDFEVNNLAGGTIDARGGSGSGISFQVGNTSPEVNVQTGSFSNAGLIAGAGGGPVDAGVRLFDGNGALASAFQGDIVNEVTGFITAEKGSDAILVQDGVDFQGAVLNAGTIDGSISLATGDLALTETSLLVLDVVGLGDPANETIFVGGDLSFDGTLEVVFHNGFLPEVGDQFDLFDVDGLSEGGFDSIISNVGAEFNTDLLLSDGILQIVAVAVPEPTSIVLVGLGGIMLLGRRRRS